MFSGREIERNTSYILKKKKKQRFVLGNMCCINTPAESMVTAISHFHLLIKQNKRDKDFLKKKIS